MTSASGGAGATGGSAYVFKQPNACLSQHKDEKWTNIEKNGAPQTVEGEAARVIPYGRSLRQCMWSPYMPNTVIPTLGYTQVQLYSPDFWIQCRYKPDTNINHSRGRHVSLFQTPTAHDVVLLLRPLPAPSSRRQQSLSRQRRSQCQSQLWQLRRRPHLAPESWLQFSAIQPCAPQACRFWPSACKWRTQRPM